MSEEDPRILKHCSCGKTYSASEFMRLPGYYPKGLWAGCRRCSCASLLLVPADLLKLALTNTQVFTCVKCDTQHVDPVDADPCSFCDHDWGAEITNDPPGFDDTHTPRNERD